MGGKAALALDATWRVTSNTAKKAAKPYQLNTSDFCTWLTSISLFSPHTSFATPHPQPSHPRPAMLPTSFIHSLSCLISCRFCCLEPDDTDAVPRKTSFQAW